MYIPYLARISRNMVYNLHVYVGCEYSGTFFNAFFQIRVSEIILVLLKFWVVEFLISLINKILSLGFPLVRFCPGLGPKFLCYHFYSVWGWMHWCLYLILWDKFISWIFKFRQVINQICIQMFDKSPIWDFVIVYQISS